MKITCEIIRDLLPLYHDGVLSDDSKALVKEHISYCEKCKAELREMDGELLGNNPARHLNEAEAVKNLSRRWRKGLTLSLIKGALISLAFLALLALILYVLMDIRVVPKTF